MKSPSRSRNNGVTLIELMVTVAVLAVVLTLAVPSFVDFFDKNRVRGAADEVVSLVSNARAAAVRSDRDVRITFGGTTGAWCVGANAAADPTGGNPVGAPSSCDCTSSSECVIGSDRLAVEPGKYPGVAVDSVATDFIFNSKVGLLCDTSGSYPPCSPATATATFTSPRGKYDVRVSVNALGQASLCVPSGKPVIAGVASC